MIVYFEESQKDDAKMCCALAAFCDFYDLVQPSIRLLLKHCSSFCKP